jgi:hypothetical protein
MPGSEPGTDVESQERSQMQIIGKPKKKSAVVKKKGPEAFRASGPQAESL